jgi:hypothetical protein
MRGARLLGWLNLVLLAGCSVRCNAGDRVDMDKARSFVSDSVEQYTKIKPTKVTCPDEAKAAKGANIVCTFEVAGVSGNMTMQLADTKGSLATASMTGIIASSKIEESVRAELEKRGMTLSVDCGARVHPSKPGDVIACDARRGQDVVGRVSVTIDNEQNDLTLKFVPTGTPTRSAPSAARQEATL